MSFLKSLLLTMFLVTGFIPVTAGPARAVDLLVSDNNDGVLQFDGKTGAFIGHFVPPDGTEPPGANGLVFGPNGDLYVGGFDFPGSILRFNGQTGAFITTFVPPGSGGLNYPQGLVFGPDGNLYVSSVNTASVLRYNGTTGAFIDSFVQNNSGGLSGPTGLVFGPDGNLYVCRFNFPGGVLRYNGTTGAFIDVFVAPESGGLSSPEGLVFGPDGNLYVSSAGNDSLLRYNGTTGTFIDAFVPSGSGGLDFPVGLVFGPDGNLYVSSAGFPGKIVRYNGVSGAFIDAFVTTGSGGLGIPAYLTFTPKIRVAVDIKPGKTPNTVNLTKEGVIPVAILSTTAFDATSIAPETVRFGITGTEATPVQFSFDDVNKDKVADMILHFRVQDAAIVCETTSAIITGTTFDNREFEGSDSIVVVSCK
jgi:DNA-binding beta-propeller fold protein YncE